MGLLDYRDPTHRRAEERLGRELVAWLTTVSPRGRPQSTPVWFWWDGSTFLVYSRPGKQKLRNIAANPRVSLHLDGDGLGGDNVIFEGEAAVATDVPPANEMPGYLDKYRSRIEQNGWTPQDFAADYSVPIRVRPTRLRVW